ncbi:chemotaxis protein CheX [Cellulomonas fengjieae]|uniref:Chemotaxis protein CheX n=1 Tax=Cellulomonas fengjieae TaxID=2819978 RepID=A0ABS3SLQ5_9CELL|nr:chemotaxis protein CheX [Cellulomonas fengjieae]MBO3086662.1 chemotaxis protein CheX [Cellulomonas fengjieae]QVI66490.1 chemotaxis protein CheX [Cellulomonas fengjieae]
MSTVVERDQVLAIAQEVFAAMVDGDTGLLQPWSGDEPALHGAVVAWVDLHGPWTGRAELTTELATAQALARVLLEMRDDEAVSQVDLVDAFGEVANVVGGNVKSLLPLRGSLGLPQVAPAAPVVRGAVLVQNLSLSWRGRPLVVSVWAYDQPALPEGTSLA